MSLVAIDAAACAKDGLCVRVCPTRCLHPGEDGVPYFEPPYPCIRCGHCVAVCPTGALRHEELPEASFLPIPRTSPVSPDELHLLMRMRRSVRGFKPEPLGRPELDALFETARHAPTGSNSQKVRWAVHQGADTCRDIASAVVEWMRSASFMPHHVATWDLGGEPVLRGASTLALAFAPEKYRMGQADCVIAATYLELVAAAMNLGVCWGGIVMYAAAGSPHVRELLRVPEGHTLHAALMLGRPAFRYRLAPPRNPAQVEWY